jgi:hypothetical protein
MSQKQKHQEEEREDVEKQLEDEGVTADDVEEVIGEEEEEEEEDEEDEDEDEAAADDSDRRRRRHRREMERENPYYRPYRPGMRPVPPKGRDEDILYKEILQKEGKSPGEIALIMKALHSGDEDDPDARSLISLRGYFDDIQDLGDTLESIPSDIRPLVAPSLAREFEERSRPKSPEEKEEARRAKMQEVSDTVQILSGAGGMKQMQDFLDKKLAPIQNELARMTEAKKKSDLAAILDPVVDRLRNIEAQIAAGGEVKDKETRTSATSVVTNARKKLEESLPDLNILLALSGQPPYKDVSDMIARRKETGFNSPDLEAQMDAYARAKGYEIKKPKYGSELLAELKQEKEELRQEYNRNTELAVKKAKEEAESKVNKLDLGLSILQGIFESVGDLIPPQFQNKTPGKVTKTIANMIASGRPKLAGVPAATPPAPATG